ncbi:MAG: ATP synthase F1 subunit delta [Paramuribaculum sp.]|nr:ATP synthase F1 subunit delta [Paramuribaculum sp.]
MNEGLIPRRYAKALYLVARERGVATDIYEKMKTLERNFMEFPQLGDSLNNPYISLADKALLIGSAVASPDGKNDSTLSDFIKLLEKNRRIGMMRGIGAAYVDIYRELHDIYSVRVESAAPLSASEENRLKKMIQNHLGGGVMEYEMNVDPSLIGGFTVSVGNEKIDASVSNELKQLRLNLISK